MRKSPLLITLGTVLVFSTAGPLSAQVPPTALPSKPTNGPAVTGVLASPLVFEWKRASLAEFLDHIKKAFGYDLRAHADIPDEMLHHKRVVVVPSMKVETARVWDVLDLYNSISKDYPELGSWVVNWTGVKTAGSDQPLRPGMVPSDPLSGPTALYLVAPQQTDTEDSLSVRAFTLRGIPGPEQELLFKLIDVEKGRLQDRLQKFELDRRAKTSLDVHFHKETGILVATGGKAYVEMVGSLIDAFQEGRGAGGLRKLGFPYSVKPQDEK